jgi:hypothetical protein
LGTAENVMTCCVITFRNNKYDNTGKWGTYKTGIILSKPPPRSRRNEDNIFIVDLVLSAYV